MSAREALASVMEAPPREKRARAAFFREKDAKRAAKQQRKKEKLTEKISLGGALVHCCVCSVHANVCVHWSIVARA